MTDIKAIAKLAIDVYRGSVNTNFTNGQNPHEKLMEYLIEANGGSTKIDFKTIRGDRYPKVFAILEEIIPVLKNEGLQGDEFFMNLVESRNLALGDSNMFTTKDDIDFVVADIASGTQGLRRQRLTGGQSITVHTQLRGIKIYEELNLLLSGRVDFNTFIDKVNVAFKKRFLDDVFTTFTGMFDNLSSTYNVAGTANQSEEEVLTLTDHVEADTGAKAVIYGTKPAIRKLGTVNMSDNYKDDLYNMGYYGKWNGIPVVAINNRHKVGSTDFILPNDEIWVLAGDDKPIKHVTEGTSTLLMGDPMKNADLSQEFLYMEQEGIATMFAQAKGRYEFAV